MRNDIAIPTFYLRQIADYLAEQGASAASWLAAQKLSMADLQRQGGWIDFASYERLLFSAIQLSGDPAIGLRLGQRLPLHAHGALSLALLNSDNLNQAVQLFCRYLRTRTPLLAVETQTLRGDLQLCLTESHALPASRTAFLETAMLAVYNALEGLQKGAVKAVSFDFAAPDHVAEYRRLFACHVEFCRPSNSLLLAAEYLDKPLLAADPQSLAQAKHLCETALTEARKSVSYRQQVFDLLVASPSLDLNAIAQKLHLSARTLHRRLRQEGSSFAQVRAAALGQQATTLLQQGQSVKAVALQLGYQDVANFRRAFKRWQGCCPSALATH